MPLLAKILNQRIYADKLAVSWARGYVASLTQAFFDLDPVGLKCVGCPSDEYEPEALLVVAKLHGFAIEANFLESPRPEQVTASKDALRAACEEAFSSLFGRDFSGAFDGEGFLEKALRCALGSFDEKENERPSINRPL